MKNIFLLLVSSFFLFGCEERSNEYYLYHGLEDYDKFRYIDEAFIDEYGIHKIAFFREADELQYVLMLKDNVTPETVKNYSLGLQVYADKKLYKPENDRFLLWDTKPVLRVIGGHKYIINSFNQRITKIDSIRFFIYGREVYNGVVGKAISIKNIMLDDNANYLNSSK